MSLHAPEHVGLVTGAGSGIARVIAHQLCADGITKIALIDINKAAVEQTAKMIETRYPSAKTMVFVADISQENGADAAIAAAVKEFGRLDCCVNAAGVQGPFRPTGEQATPDMDKIVNVDLRGLWFCERAELREFMKQDMRPLTTMPSLKTRGAILNISSVLGTIAMPGCSPYNMAKHGVIGLTRSDAIDYAEHGVRVNAIGPGFCRNGGTVEASSHLVDAAAWDALDAVYEATPMKRLGTLEEIAYTTSFFLCDRSSFTTGINLNIDGGFTAK